MTEDLKKALNYFKGDELAASTWKNKYAAEGELTPDDTHKRVSKELFRVENKYSKNKKTSTIHEKSKYGKTRKDLTYDDIYNLLKDFKYVIPGGSILAGLGVKDKLVSLSNCFVIGSPKDSYSGIMKTRSEQVQLMKRRGGCIEENVKVIERNKGIIPIKEIEKGDEVLSFNIDTNKDEFKKVLDWYYTDVKLDEQIEVKYQNGVSLLTSSRHPILSLKNNGYAYESYEKEGLKDNVNKTISNNYHWKENDSPIDNNIAWFIGNHMGDGCSNLIGDKQNKCRIRLTSADKEVVEKYASILQNLNKSSVNVVKSTNKNYKIDVWECSSTNKNNVKILEDLFDNQSNKKTYSWFVPKFIIDNDLYVPFIAGLTDSDGYITKSGRIDISICSKTAVENIASYLSSKGQRYSTSIKEPTRDNESTIYNLHIHNTSAIYNDIKKYIVKNKHLEKMCLPNKIQSLKIKLTDNELNKISSIDILSKFSSFSKEYNDCFKKVKHAKLYKSIGLASLTYFSKLGVFTSDEFDEISSRVSLKEVIKDNEKKKNYIDIMVADNNNYYTGNFGFVNIHNCGYDLSNIRPRGSKVNNAANRSTGAASFMEVNSDLTKETSQEGRRKRVLNY